MRYFITLLIFSIFLTSANLLNAQETKPGMHYKVQQPDKDSFEFLGSYPNPVREYSYFKFQLSSQQQVQVQLFDLLGKQKRAIDKEVYNSGTHTLKLDVSGLKPGIYFYKIHIRDKTITERLNIVK